MHDGLQKSLHLLSRTKNEAATAVLLLGLRSPQRATQMHCLQTLLERRSDGGHAEILAMWHELPEELCQIAADYPGRLTKAIRDALFSADARRRINACRAAAEAAEYDLIPVLVNACEDRRNPVSDLAADTLVKICTQLCEEAAGRRDYNRRDPQMVRARMLASLEASVQRYADHRREAPLLAFLLLAGRENPTLLRILQDPKDAAHDPLCLLLSQSGAEGVLRLLLDFLEERQPPVKAIKTIQKRKDLLFVRSLLAKTGPMPRGVVKDHLFATKNWAWLDNDLSMLAGLNEQEQTAAVALVAESGMRPDAVRRTLTWLAEHGASEGRAAAILALKNHQDEDSDSLVLKALKDPDPDVQAAAILQLRERGVPGAMRELLARVDSPYPQVAEAVRVSLAEFTLDRFLGAFDMLDDQVRRQTGELVRRVDPQVVRRLQAEMANAVSARRRRAIEATVVMEMVGELENDLCARLQDDDHLVRRAAVNALAGQNTPESRQALRGALLDRSPVVRRAVETALRGAKAASPKTNANRNDGGVLVTAGGGK